MNVKNKSVSKKIKTNFNSVLLSTGDIVPDNRYISGLFTMINHRHFA